MNKSYVYKWFTGEVYNGVIDKSLVVSEPSIRQEINTAGAQLRVDLALGLQDANAQQTTDLLVDENANFIVTDDQESIVVDSDISIDGFPNLNDRIELWEYSDDYPTGVLKFNGLVSSWASDYSTSKTTLSVLSYGVQLDNFLVQILPGETLVENSNTDSTEILYALSVKTPEDRVVAAGQTFSVGADTDVVDVSLVLGNPGTFSVNCRVSIVEGTPTSPGAVAASVTRSVPSQANTSTTFTFSSPVTLTASTQYHFMIENTVYGASETNSISIAIDTNSNFSGGAMYLYNESSGWYATSYDLGFSLTTTSGGIGNRFLSYDPGQIVRELMDNFIALGGNLTYTNSSVALSGTTVSYTFKVSTYLDAIKKCTELAPANWWWAVDVATGELTFSSLSQEADHTFIRGVHLSDITISRSLETVKNVLYFTGGDIGDGTNLFTNYRNSASVSDYGTWLALVSDNRVKIENTADTLGEAYVNEYKDPCFNTTLVIPSNLYDVNTISVGQVVSFANFNSLVDNLLLQIKSIDYRPDSVTLTLDVLPPSVPKRIEDIKRNLEKQQTENNIW